MAWVLLMFALAATLFGSDVASANLLENGDFSEIEGAAVDVAPIVGWVTTGSPGAAMESRLFNGGDGLASFNANSVSPDGAISQEFTTAAGAAYRLTFEYGMWVAPGTAAFLVEVLDGGSTVFSQQFSDTTGTALDFDVDTTERFSGQLQLDGTGTDLTLRFTDESVNGAMIDLHLDNVAVVGPLLDVTADAVLSDWTSGPAPQWNQADEDTVWELASGGVAQVANGADTRVSAFGFQGDFTFTGVLRAIPEPDLDQDDDNLGVVFGWQDESNHYRLGFEGGGFGDNGDEFDPFVDEGASGAHGLWLVREQGGVATVLLELPSTFWQPETDYGFTVARNGDEISFSVTEGLSVVGSATVVDTTFPAGRIGLYVESQEAEFRDLAVTEPDIVGPCPAAPTDGCTAAGRAKLVVTERKQGKEKLKVSLAGFVAETTQQSFGDPATGDTSYALCLYDEGDDLVEALTVAPGGTCGPKAKPCWKAVSTKGWAFKDPEGLQSGVRKLKVKSGAEEKGKLQLLAGNKASKGQQGLPQGITAALEGQGTVRVQVRTSDPACFDASLRATKAESDLFKGKAP